MKIIAGVDEVGRGSLIGPVYAAAVILNKSINKNLLRDSKSLTKKTVTNIHTIQCLKSSVRSGLDPHLFLQHYGFQTLLSA